MTTEKTIRAFVAMEFPKEVLEVMAGLQKDLNRGGLNLRWVKPAGMHLTLKFLGDTPPSRIDGIKPVLEAVATRHAPVKLKAQGLGVFPNFRRPRVLWAGMAGQTEELAAIHQDLEQGWVQLGIEPDKRKFAAHLTIGRAKATLDTSMLTRLVGELGNYDPREFTAHALTLYKSDLQPTGAVYTALGQYELTGKTNI